MINTYSFPFKTVASHEMPTSKAPVALTIPIKPPIIRTNKIISETPMIPFRGDFIKAIIPCGLGSNL